MPIFSAGCSRSRSHIAGHGVRVVCLTEDRRQTASFRLHLHGQCRIRVLLSYGRPIMYATACLRSRMHGAKRRKRLLLQRLLLVGLVFDLLVLMLLMTVRLGDAVLAIVVGMLRRVSALRIASGCGRDRRMVTESRSRAGSAASAGLGTADDRRAAGFV